MDDMRPGVADLLKLMEAILEPRYQKGYVQRGTEALFELTPGVSWLQHVPVML